MEGITDVWRLGKLAFATFGIEYTRQQVRLISSLYKRVGIAYDFEIQAQRQAKELMADLKFRGVDCFLIPIEDDPGSMKQEQVNQLLKQIKLC